MHEKLGQMKKAKEKERRRKTKSKLGQTGNNNSKQMFEERSGERGSRVEAGERSKKKAKT